MKNEKHGSFFVTVLFCFLLGFAGVVLVIFPAHLGLLFVGHMLGDMLLCWLFVVIGCFFGFFGTSAVHELSHYGVAKLIGVHVHKVQIGCGRLLYTLNLFSTLFEFRASLAGGGISYKLRSVHRARTNLTLFVCAGPLASLIVAGDSIALLIYIIGHPPTSSPLNLLIPFVVGWTISACLIFLAILPPNLYGFSGKAIESEGLQLLLIPLVTEEALLEHVNSSNEENDHLKQLFQEALNELFPSSESALFSTAFHLANSGEPQALVVYRKLLEKFPNSINRSICIAGYLTAALDQDSVLSNSKEMDTWSSKLITSKPGKFSAMTIRGCILVDLGRLEDGKPILQMVMEQTQHHWDKLYSTIFLSLAEQKLGNLDAAHKYAESAVKLTPSLLAIKRLEKAGLINSTSAE